MMVRSKQTSWFWSLQHTNSPCTLSAVITKCSIWTTHPKPGCMLLGSPGAVSQKALDQASSTCSITCVEPLAVHALHHEQFMACREQPDILSVGCWNGTLSQYDMDGKQVGKAKDLGFMPCCVSYMPNGMVLELGVLSHAYLKCFLPRAYLHRMSSHTYSGQASFIAYDQVTFVTPTTLLCDLSSPLRTQLSSANC